MREGGREEEGIVYENRNRWERERYRVKRKSPRIRIIMGGREHYTSGRAAL